ncbi:unnamed protein product, partial [Symbiodinium microadriaticum]
VIEVAEGNGDEDELIAPSPIWTPMVWKRAHLMLASMLLELFMMVVIEFSYSATFADSVYMYIVLFKVCQKWMDYFFEDMLKEMLMINPLVILYTVTEGLITMGADDFSDFILSYFVELCVMVVERLYLDPGLGEINKLWPRWMMQLKRSYGSNRRMTREEKAEEELEWRRINEEIELESEGIEPLLDSYSGYSTEELVHGWKVYDYVSYQRYRFSVREHRWMLRSSLLDESISEGFQTLDMLCFSSQYYFIITLFAMGMLMIIFGMTIYVQNSYNPFADPVACLLIVLMIIGSDGEGTVDDDVAAKLAIGEGRQQDLEQERMELQALNSERFRHRFLERNRPWILQHLVELITPRSLENPGHDGRPVVEYVRDVYAELMAMGEGMKRAGDRADISSDEDDELEDARRNWSRQPLTGTNLAIARLWLAK